MTSFRRLFRAIRHGNAFFSMSYHMGIEYKRLIRLRKHNKAIGRYWCEYC